MGVENHSLTLTHRISLENHNPNQHQMKLYCRWYVQEMCTYLDNIIINLSTEGPTLTFL